MTGTLSKISTSRIARGIRIYALLCLVFSILSVSVGDMVVTNASAQVQTCSAINENASCFLNGGTSGSTGTCQQDADRNWVCVAAPEIPLAMLPVFLLMSAGAFYAMRRRSLRTSLVAC